MRSFSPLFFHGKGKIFRFGYRGEKLDFFREVLYNKEKMKKWERGVPRMMKQQTDRLALSAECKAAMERVRRENEAFLAANGRAPRVFVLTFGCQQNEADSEKIAGMCISM